MNRLALLIAVLFVSHAAVTFANDLDFLSQFAYPARDSLKVGDESSQDARECLKGLSWTPGDFRVVCQPPKPNRGDALVRFSSPISTKDKRNDSVAMEWYVARDRLQRPITAPAVVVVHESGRGMVVGRLFARGLRKRGLHAFLLHLPFYGERRSERKAPDASNIFAVIRQAVADVRRARDAVAVLPHVDASHIALQGTSLGGFVSSTSAGLDEAFDSVFLFLSGGDLYNLILNGKRDTAKVRAQLQTAGITDQQLKQLVYAIEPTRLAHRLRPERTWLYSGRFDTVVPMANANALASAARLNADHHVCVSANHYSGIVLIPFLFRHIADCIKRLAIGKTK